MISICLEVSCRLQSAAAETHLTDRRVDARVWQLVITNKSIETISLPEFA